MATTAWPMPRDGLRCGRGALFVALFLAGCATTPPPVLPHLPLQGIWVTTVEGDTLTAIAAKYAVPIEDIEELNGIDHRDPLPVGTEIFVPLLSPTPKTAKPEPDQRTARDAFLATFAWPVAEGQITSHFGRRGRSVHEGIDIAAKEGTPILAAADGEVIYEGSGLSGYGNLILIRHAEDIVTVYAHNRRNLVQQGTRVKRGQVIAEVGSTGRSTGPHLHFELRIGDRPIDPLKHLRAP